MTSLATVFELSSAKNCFLSTKSGRKRQERNSGPKLLVYETTLKDGRNAYLSLSGDGAEIRSGDCVLLNGLFAEKLGIRDSQEVVLKPVEGPLTFTHNVNVEPLTVDDWEILERSASTVETGLLDQIRVVWPGQVIPVWVERSICIYITVESATPCGTFAVLDSNTCITVAPKVRIPQQQLSTDLNHRHPSLTMPDRQEAIDMTGQTPPDIGNPKKQPSLQMPAGSPVKIPRTASLQPTDSSPRKVYKKHGSPGRSRRGSRSAPGLSADGSELAEVTKRPMLRRHTDQRAGSMLMDLFSSFLSGSRYQPKADTRVDQVPHDGADDDEDEQPEFLTLLQGNLVYRTQSLDLTMLYDRLREALERRAYEDEVDGDEHHAPAELLQPSTIYVSGKDISGRRLGGYGVKSSPRVYFAELRKLQSARDREKAQVEARKSREKANNKMSTAGREQQQILGEGSQVHCVVRVVTVERSEAATVSPWQQAALAVLGEEGLVHGHAVVPAELRRQLMLDSTGSMWVKAGDVAFTHPGTILLFPISIVPRTVDDKMLAAAFKSWVMLVADEDHPLVAFHGMLVRFKISSTVYVEAQLLLGSGIGNASLLTRSKIRRATVIVQRDSNEDIPMPGVLTPMLAYKRVDDFDPKPPREHLDQLGGVADLGRRALHHLEACLGSRPLPRKLLRDRPGLNNGLLLLTGPKGSGKTSLAGALCHAVSKSPTLAYTFTVDCKPFRGKSVKNIQSQLEAAFDEAAWRQPAVICLDDFDVIAPASNNPAAEMSGEALYAAKVSEVLEGLVKFEMRNFSRLAVIVTSQSRSSLHPSLVSPSGLHFVQEVITIKPPDKEGRKKLLKSILQSHSTVKATNTLERLDMNCIVSRTEGFVARDLQTLVNRALHFHLATSARADSRVMTLRQEDFDSALEGFKHMAIRNVPLHTAGETSWSDVGGLEEVKTSLIETLQWPSKYPQLFASCPLRLRSGLLLYGPPGTGKTLLAGAVARECCLNFISIKGPELLSKYIGASEQAVRDLFTRAQSAKPCILFFDEFDSIAPKRGHDSTGVTDRVVNQLLTQLDGVEGLQGVYMLAATSRPDLIDPALLRPGRLDKCLYCNIPTKEERRKILEALTTRMVLCDDVELDDIADVCEFFTGADFKALLYNAQLQAIHEYTDAERALGGHNALLRIKGSPDTCSMVSKSPITISAKKSPSPLVNSPPALTMQPSDDGELVENGKVAVAVTVSGADSPRTADPGPAGDAAPASEDLVEAETSATTRCAPPSHLEVGDGLSKSGQVKTVTFFPKMGDAAAILTPEDEARLVSMVEAIHRRQGHLVPRTPLEKRRASSVLAKAPIMVPVGHRHLQAAAKALRPSVSATERLRYQAIYDNFVSGRQGDFNAGNNQTGMRTTLA